MSDKPKDEAWKGVLIKDVHTDPRVGERFSKGCARPAEREGTLYAYVGKGAHNGTIVCLNDNDRSTRPYFEDADGCMLDILWSELAPYAQEGKPKAKTARVDNVTYEYSDGMQLCSNGCITTADGNVDDVDTLRACIKNLRAQANSTAALVRRWEKHFGNKDA